MSLTSPTIVTTTIRTRIGRYGSDVPTFARALRAKVNSTQTTIQKNRSTGLQIDSAIAVLRADPFGGQTSESAQSTVVVHSEFFEDPRLIAPTLSAASIRAHLRARVPVRINILPMQHIYLSETHTKGILDRVVLPEKTDSWITQYEEVWYGLKKIPKLQIEFPDMRTAFFPAVSRALIVSSLVLLLLTVGPMIALELQSIRQQVTFSLQNFTSKAIEKPPAKVDLIVKKNPAATPVPTANPSPEKQFQILIPKIGVNSKVIANVDPANEKEYTAALQKGIVHAKGTGLPGEKNSENKTIFLFGHSTNGVWNIVKYNALFYALKDLEIGDTFTIWFWGVAHTYTISEKRIVEAADVSFLEPQVIKDQVILQTCWPPGTSIKRLIVVGEESRL